MPLFLTLNCTGLADDRVLLINQVSLTLSRMVISSLDSYRRMKLRRNAVKDSRLDA